MDAAPAKSELDLGSLISSCWPLGLAMLAADGNPDYAAIKRELRGLAKRDPIDALLAVALGGGVAFYLAERDSNPSVAGPWDGILYMATCFSVGYDNCFPTTTAGHALATLVQTFGPALAGMALDAPAEATVSAEDEALVVQRQILARLDDIVKLLDRTP